MPTFVTCFTQLGSRLLTVAQSGNQGGNYGGNDDSYGVSSSASQSHSHRNPSPTQSLFNAEANTYFCSPETLAPAALGVNRVA